MRLPFHHALKRKLIEAFSGAAVSPETVARQLFKAVSRPCGKQEGDAFRAWLNQRGISRLVHFTQLGNVPNIVQFGLIPREYLELELVKLALRGQFTDDKRLDGTPQFNCLSITSPNYSMFYKKRQRLSGRWAVIEYDAQVLARLYFAFTPSNAASKGAAPAPGVSGAERLFMRPDLRARLGLMPHEPTDPQAEGLCDSLLTKEHILGIYVEAAEDVIWLKRKGIISHVNGEYFKPRRDYGFWSGKTIASLPDSL